MMSKGRGLRVSRAYLSAVDHEAKLDSPIRIGTSSESFGSAKLDVENILNVDIVRRIERYLLWCMQELVVVRRMERHLGRWSRR